MTPSHARCDAGSRGFRDLADRPGSTRRSAAAGGRHPGLPRRRPFRVGLLVPWHGADAIWGPSCQYSAVLAAAELNEGGGILGREIELFTADAGGAPADVAARAEALLTREPIDIFVGTHLSSVRVALRQAFAGRIPYVFAPLYEGGERSPGVFAIGETPDHQFPGAVHWFHRRRDVRRWYLVGNDYVWPRASHHRVRSLVESQGGAVVGEDYVPLGEKRSEWLVDRIRAARPDIVFQSLVGSDCVAFNRHFARAGLDAGIIRLSGAIEENTLLGIGAENTHDLFCVAGYFSALRTPENQAFMARYNAAFGSAAPVQGNLSQSCYEAIRFVAFLVAAAGQADLAALEGAFERLRYSGARGTAEIRDGVARGSTFLARADGTRFEVIKAFPAA